MLAFLGSVAQTVVYSENFDPPSGPDSISTSGNPLWTTNNILSVSSPQSFWSSVSINDTSIFVTDTFSTVGNSFVIMNFEHICKIEFFDFGIIEASNDGGATWVPLNCANYLGGSTFCGSGNKFTSIAYPTVWLPGNPAAIPDNTWWQSESFDLSSILSNSANCQVRFVLYDGNFSGGGGNYGWLIDDLEVIAAPSELNPPVITLLNPPTGPVSNTSPYSIQADITDASGIDTAMVIYTLNTTFVDTVPMVNIGGDTYEGFIPGAVIGDTICFEVLAFDASPALNSATAPASACNQFWIVPVPPLITVGTGTGQNTGTSYPAPYGNWYNGARHQMLITASELNALGVNGAANFNSLAFNVIQVNGTPLTDFTLKMGNYASATLSTFVSTGMTQVFYAPSYTEVLGWNTHTFSNSFQWDGVSNVLVEVCFNNYPNGFTNNAVTQYTTYPNTRTIYYRSDVDANLCSNSSAFVTSSNDRPNMQFTVGSPQPDDVAALSILQPINGGCSLTNSEPVVIQVKNAGTDPQDTIPVAYQINGGSIVLDTIFGTLNPGDTATFTFTQTADFSTPGTNYLLDVWVQLGTDVVYFNDSIVGYPVNNTLTILPYSQNFDTWTAGGTTLSDNWTQAGPPSIAMNVGTGPSPGFNTGPTADHTTGNGNYLYSPNNFSFYTSGVITPCIDLTTTTAPKLDFYYHLYGTGIGTLFVEILDSSGTYVNAWSLTGNQGNQWNNALLDLSSYTGQIIKIRFRHANIGFSSEAAIDDILIYEPQPNDISFIGFTDPVANDCGYSANQQVTVQITNFGTSSQDTIPLAFTMNNGTVILDTLFQTLNPGDTALFTFSQTVDMSAVNTSYTFQGYSLLPNEQNTMNDTVSGYVVTHTPAISSFPHTEDFESFTAGNGTPSTPGQFANGWTLNPSPLTTNSFAWLVNTGTTSSFGTGPNGDHTPGLNGNGKYVYTESSYGAFNDESSIISPCLDFSALTNPAVEFYYHRFGTNMGPTYVDVFTGGVWVAVDTITAQPQTANTSPWERHQTDLTAYAGSFVKVRWRQQSLGCCAGDAAIDDIRFYEPQNYDAAVIAILSPGTQSGAGSSNNVSVQLFNYGTQTLDTIDVAYSVNGGPSTIEMWTGTLAPNTSTVFNFATPFNAPSGSYSICAWTELVNEQAPQNDTTCATSTGIPTIVIPYFTDFENGVQAWVSTGGNGQWQLGSPGGSVINSSYSGSNAWMTQLSSNYQNNSNDFLYTPLFDFSQSFDAELRFWHWFSSENSFDGGRVDISVDGGTTFSVLGTAFSTVGTNWYNTSNLFGSGQPGWAGNQNGWQQSTYPLDFLNSAAGLVQFRFNFSSDGSVNNYDGWAIDDFELYLPIQRSAASTRLVVGSSNSFILPSSANVSSYIKNTGVSPLTQVDITLEVDGSVIVTDNVTFTTSLAPGDSTLHTFSAAWSAAPGPHNLCAFTSNPNGGNDDFISDDTTCVQVVVLDSTSTYPYCNDFDSGQPEWLTLNAFSYRSNSIWEVGAPSQSALGSAFSGVNCWMTDLDGNYSSADSSALYTPVFNVDAGQCYNLNFRTKYFTQIYEDGGTVEWSQDLQTWNRLGNAFDPQWFNTQFVLGLGPVNPGVPGFSGTSAGWIPVQHDVQFPQSGSVVFRFRFGSDGSVENEGWAIDDVCFEEVSGPCQVSQEELGWHITNLFPNPASEAITLELYSDRTEQSLVEIYNLVGQRVFADNLQLNAGENSIRVNVSSLQNGMYYLRTTLGGRWVQLKFNVID